MDNFYQKQKSQVFTYVNIYPTSLQGRNIGQARQVKCKTDSGAGANVMSLGDHKRWNPQSLMMQEILF